MPDYVQRALRTLLQLLAGGGFAALFSALIDMTDVRYQALLAGFFVVLVAFAQNYLEDEGLIPAVMKGS